MRAAPDALGNPVYLMAGVPAAVARGTAEDA